MEHHLTATECHLPYGITQCYLLGYPTQVNTPRLHPSQSGRYSIYLPRRDGRLSDLLHTEMVNPPADGHPSKY